MPDTLTIGQFADDIRLTHTRNRGVMESLGQHLATLAETDQLVATLRAAGWCDIAIGAYLVVSMLSSADAIPEHSSTVGLMSGAVYHLGGDVRG
jgi:hypothetical protein